MGTDTFKTSDVFKWAGILLVLVVGAIHAVLSPEYLDQSTYIGVLFIANAVGAVVAAFGIFKNMLWGWLLGILISAGAFIMFIISRTAGLPGLDEKSWELSGILSLVVEALFVVLFVVASTATSNSPVRDNQS